jgi:hypothetical protein
MFQTPMLTLLRYLINMEPNRLGANLCHKAGCYFKQSKAKCIVLVEGEKLDCLVIAVLCYDILGRVGIECVE